MVDQGLSWPCRRAQDLGRQVDLSAAVEPDPAERPIRDGTVLKMDGPPVGDQHPGGFPGGARLSGEAGPESTRATEQEVGTACVDVLCIRP